MKICKTALLILLFLFSLTPANKSLAGVEQIIIPLGMDLLNSLFGSTKGKETAEEKKFREEIINNARNSLKKYAPEIKNVRIKFDGIITFTPKCNVAFFQLNDDGCYFYALEDGISVFWYQLEPRPDVKKFYLNFLKEENAAKRETIRDVFKENKCTFPSEEECIASSLAAEEKVAAEEKEKERKAAEEKEEEEERTEKKRHNRSF
ncbi:hypothetical protein KKH16_00685 [Patescibacteria group bacterium]|nr:hypothetical protein [Patescibacteria group bacterium]